MLLHATPFSLYVNAFDIRDFNLCEVFTERNPRINRGHTVLQSTAFYNVSVIAHETKFSDI
jgi:hypothetical protein